MRKAGESALARCVTMVPMLEKPDKAGSQSEILERMRREFVDRPWETQRVYTPPQESKVGPLILEIAEKFEEVQQA